MYLSRAGGLENAGKEVGVGGGGEVNKKIAFNPVAGALVSEPSPILSIITSATTTTSAENATSKVTATATFITAGKDVEQQRVWRPIRLKTLSVLFYKYPQRSYDSSTIQPPKVF